MVYSLFLSEDVTDITYLFTSAILGAWICGKFTEIPEIRTKLVENTKQSIQMKNISTSPISSGQPVRFFSFVV